MSDAETTRVICTDFGATLDLSAAEKDNCSVDNHAVIDIFFVVSKLSNFMMMNVLRTVRLG
eukprot:CAMPEP_0171322350 /NCGR_PEP_ID=MMETSP0816-20121228/114902_1 /TAXON_ID=420281 /ORGANISM="Proboscia inermis, Strain CCAP1064/1" /LENGTH=60 /DNA_ID=CAMNT_0011820801 /DNA_START=1216 /DNA_END=1401 /DNA_ORIENTATION=+